MMRMKQDGHEGFDLRMLLLAASLLLLIGIGGLFYYTGIKRDLNSITRNKSLAVLDSIVKYPVPAHQNAVTGLKGKTNPDTINNPGKTKINPGKQLALANNYSPYLPFESLVGTTMRSWDFKLVAPKQSRIQKGIAILFQWKTDRELLISLKIMDNKGNLVYEKKSGFNKILEIKQNTLMPGLYYFKFLANEEIIYFGKFEIG